MNKANPKRRRIVLMRHGAVDYIDGNGIPVLAETVPLTERGRAQADAAGSLFARHDVGFDRVIASGLPRTMETAQRVLAAGGQAVPIEVEPKLREIRGGSVLHIPRQELAAEFAAFTRIGNVEDVRFLGGESIGSLLDRVIPAFASIVASPGWHCLLLVLHGAVNRAILSHALTGGRSFLGRIEQSPACINIIDVGVDDFIVRATNLAPTQWLHEHERDTSMERLLSQYLGRCQP
ncbi:2,3-bisphosphoglycerate-dependent phosphoglycerate mutase [compost metagenome]